MLHLFNPVQRGWVNCFTVGHAGECFSFVKDRKRWPYVELKLFPRLLSLSRCGAESAPSMMGLEILEVKKGEA